MVEVWAVLFVLGLLLALFLHVFTLPANWIILGLAALWKWTHPGTGLSWDYFLLLFLLACIGEAFEFAAQALGARRGGATSRGNLGGLVGGVAGAIVGAPFLFGLGALAGVLAGSFLGCLAVELASGKGRHEAWRAATGAFLGRFAGLVVKFGLGVAMIVLLVPRIWPG